MEGYKGKINPGACLLLLRDSRQTENKTACPRGKCQNAPELGGMRVPRRERWSQAGVSMQAAIKEMRVEIWVDQNMRRTEVISAGGSGAWRAGGEDQNDKRFVWCHAGISTDPEMKEGKNIMKNKAKRQVSVRGQCALKLQDKEFGFCSVRNIGWFCFSALFNFFFLTNEDMHRTLKIMKCKVSSL